MEEKVDKMLTYLYENVSDGKAWDKVRTELLELLKPDDMNKYKCTGCGTIYSTPEDKAPPTPNWNDGHKCTLVKV